jgi:hypothetical protein
MAGARDVPAVDEREATARRREASAMASWRMTWRLVAVMAAIAVFYVLGRLVAEKLLLLAASGALRCC